MKKGLLFLLLAGQVWSCFHIPISNQQIAICNVKNDRLFCTYKTTSTINFPIQKGTCSELIYQGSVFSDLADPIFPAGGLRQTVEILDSYTILAVNDGLWCRPLDFQGWSNCDCNRPGGQCINFNPFISTCDARPRCTDDRPGVSFCETTWDAIGCFGGSFWCGCVYHNLKLETLIWAGIPGHEVTQVVMRLNISSDTVVLKSEVRTFTLSGFQNWVFDLGSSTVDMNFVPFDIPASGLQGRGGFSSIVGSNQGPWLVSNLVGASVKAPVTSPCWFRSIDGVKWGYDKSSYNQAIYRRGVNCIDNILDKSDGTNDIMKHFIDANTLVNKVNPVFNYRSFSRDSNSYVLLGHRQPIVTLQMTMIHTAKEILSVISYASVTLEGASSKYLCNDATASIYLWGKNDGDPGFTSFSFVTEPGLVTIGNSFIQGGVFNISLPFPVEQLNINAKIIRAYSDKISEIGFTPTCVLPDLPFDMDSGLGGGGLPTASVVGWTIGSILFVVALIITLVIVCKCLCKRI